MAKCLECGKENADHYKFCLGCGTELLDEPSSQDSRYAVPVSDQVAVLQAEAKDFERFGMLDEAIAKLEKIVALSPKVRAYRDKLERLRAKRG